MNLLTAEYRLNKRSIERSTGTYESITLFSVTNGVYAIQVWIFWIEIWEPDT